MYVFYVFYSYDEVFLLSFILLYLIVYNLAISLIFYLIFQISEGEWRTFRSLFNVKTNSYNLLIALVALLSLAGVPPMFGFFTKIIVLLVLINSNFFMIYMFFFTLLFLGLYFYLQNIRYLYAVSSSAGFKLTGNLVNSPRPLVLFLSLALLTLLAGGSFIEEV